MAGYDTESISIYKHGARWYTWEALTGAGYSDYTETAVATVYTLTIRATDYSRAALVWNGFRLTGPTEFYLAMVGNAATFVYGLHPIYTPDAYPSSFFNYANPTLKYVQLTATTSDSAWNKEGNNGAAVWHAYDYQVSFGTAINGTNATSGSGSAVGRSAKSTGQSISWGGSLHTKRTGYTFYVGFFANYCDVKILTGVRNKVAFDANFGQGGMNDHSVYTSGEHLLAAQKLPANEIYRTGYVFTAWNTRRDGSGTAVPDQGVPYDYGLLTNTYDDTLTLYAQWRRLGFSVSVSNELGIGSLSLEDTQGNTVATESGGALSYSTNETPSGSYRVYCTLSDGTKIPAAMTGAPSGIFTPSEGSELTFAYEPDLCAVGSYITDAAVEFSRTADAVVGGADKWLSGVELTATITPNPGKKISAWRIMDAGGVTIAAGNVSPAQTAPYDLSLNPTEDIAIGATFETAQYTVTASKDSASATALSAVWVDVAGGASGSEPSITVNYGTTVVFRATVDSGYGFAGWFASGALVDEGTASGGVYEYEVEVTADLSLSAKATAPVSAACKDGGGDPVSGASVTWTGTDEGFAVLGSTVGYTLDTNGWYLDGWFNADDMTHPLALGMSGELPVDGPIDLVAQLSETESTKTLTVHALGATGGDPLDVEDFVTFAGVTAAAQTSSTTVLAEDSTGTASHTVNGVQVVRATAAGSVTATVTVSGTQTQTTLYFMGWFADDTSNTPISSSLSVDLLVSSAERNVYVRYGGTSTVRVSADIVDAEAALMPGRVSVNGAAYADVTQGATVTLTAVALNGWRFEGWFDEPSPVTYAEPLSTSAQWTAGPIYARTTFYAHFSRETNYICEWEGSNENKTMDWRSKVYVASKPFNPTSARVDADGYPVDLAVGAWSSPDVAATSDRTARILVRDQDARRLQMMRAERYLRIDVASDSPVDAVFVGTSMEGLAV